MPAMRRTAAAVAAREARNFCRAGRVVTESCVTPCWSLRRQPPSYDSRAGVDRVITQRPGRGGQRPSAVNAMAWRRGRCAHRGSLPRGCPRTAARSIVGRVQDSAAGDDDVSSVVASSPLSSRSAARCGVTARSVRIIESSRALQRDDVEEQRRDRQLDETNQEESGRRYDAQDQCCRTAPHPLPLGADSEQ